MLRLRLPVAALSLLLGGCGAPPKKEAPLGKLPSAVTSAVPLWIPFSIGAGSFVADDPREIRLSGLRQLTTDGKSDAAVWHPSSTSILYVSGHSATTCGQLYRMDLQHGVAERVSPAQGWAGPGAFVGDRVVYASGDKSEPPCMQLGGSPMATLPAADIFAIGAVTTAPVPLIAGPGYDSEPHGTLDATRLVFTSARDGNPEIYTAAADGSDVRRITEHPGYDGLARYAPNGSKLVWVAEDAPAPGVAGSPKLQVVMAGALGQHPRVIAKQGGHNLMPAFLPDSQRVIFTSSYDEGGFDTYLVDPDGPVTATGDPRVERITYAEGFDGNASVSPDGRYIVFTSSRPGVRGGPGEPGVRGGPGEPGKPGETNIFVARWHDD